MKYLIFLLVLLITTCFAQAQPGTLDASFDGDGKIVITSAGRDEANSVAIQSDGKILVAGVLQGTWTGSPSDMVVYRFNEDGSFDNTFDTDGKVVINPGKSDGVDAMLIQPDGKILLAGYAGNSVDDGKGKAYVRLNTDGSLDNTFGTGGIAIYEYSNPIFRQKMQGLDLDASGNIYSAGYYANGPTSTGLIFKLAPDGSLDNTFDTDGKLIISGKLTIDIMVTNNKLVVNNTTEIWRLNLDGTMDNTFDSDGVFVYNTANVNDFSSASTIDSNGKIVSIGYSSDYDIIFGDYANGHTILKINTDGTADNSFGINGVKLHSVFVDNSYLSFTRLFSLPNNLLVSGNTQGCVCTNSCTFFSIPNCQNINASVTYDFVAMSFNLDGSFDANFDTDGIAIFPIVDGNREESYASAIDAQGRIVMVGYTGTSGSLVSRDFAIIRVNGPGTLGVNSPKTTNGNLTLYPNPSKGVFVLEGKDGKTIKNIEVKTLLGNLVQAQINMTDGSFKIELGDAPDQMYLLEIIDGEGAKEIIRIVKN